MIFSGSFLGALISVPLVLAARRRAPDAGDADGEPSLARVQVPFGPFLALGALIDLFAGPAILRALLGGFSDGRLDRVQAATSPMIVRTRRLDRRADLAEPRGVSASKRITSTGPVFQRAHQPPAAVLPSPSWSAVTPSTAATCQPR